jgi:hypothetical protein
MADGLTTIIVLGCSQQNTLSHVTNTEKKMNMGKASQKNKTAPTQHQKVNQGHEYSQVFYGIPESIKPQPLC